jgi:hypothetical protein
LAGLACIVGALVIVGVCERSASRSGLGMPAEMRLSRMQVVHVTWRLERRMRPYAGGDCVGKVTM